MLLTDREALLERDLQDLDSTLSDSEYNSRAESVGMYYQENKENYYNPKMIQQINVFGSRERGIEQDKNDKSEFNDSLNIESGRFMKITKLEPPGGSNGAFDANRKPLQVLNSGANFVVVDKNYETFGRPFDSEKASGNFNQFGNGDDIVIKEETLDGQDVPRHKGGMQESGDYYESRRVDRGDKFSMDGVMSVGELMKKGSGSDFNSKRTHEKNSSYFGSEAVRDSRVRSRDGRGVPNEFGVMAHDVRESIELSHYKFMEHEHGPDCNHGHMHEHKHPHKIEKRGRGRHSNRHIEDEPTVLKHRHTESRDSAGFDKAGLVGAMNESTGYFGSIEEETKFREGQLRRNQFKDSEKELVVDRTPEKKRDSYNNHKNSLGNLSNGSHATSRTHVSKNDYMQASAKRKSMGHRSGESRLGQCARRRRNSVSKLKKPPLEKSFRSEKEQKGFALEVGEGDREYSSSKRSHRRHPCPVREALEGSDYRMSSLDCRREVEGSNPQSKEYIESLVELHQTELNSVKTKHGLEIERIEAVNSRMMIENKEKIITLEESLARLEREKITFKEKVKKKKKFN